MKGLSKLQVRHFSKMTRDERLAVIRDSEQQIAHIAPSSAAAAEHKRAELQRRIDFCREVNAAEGRLKGPKPHLQRRRSCDVPDCKIPGRHIHCPECGSTEHSAADCDMEN